MHIPVIQDLLQHYCGLPATTAAQAQVVSVTETYILFMEGNPAVAYTIPLHPPVRETPELGCRIFDMWESLQMIGPGPEPSSDEARAHGMDHIRRLMPGLVDTGGTEGQPLFDTKVIPGPGSFLYSVLAIELMLRWNRVWCICSRFDGAAYSACCRGCGVFGYFAEYYEEVLGKIF
jgi:hypothetical protein